jgi:hypothetical protein
LYFCCFGNKATFGVMNWNRKSINGLENVFCIFVVLGIKLLLE